ncbi:uncharacterized protein LOC108680369 [Hyalella azteca]|uniref:Uncharacterized protein LOC108680369 n=1 Tax=Hyalella azteca TaxID=294128 RepID=A0A8B7PGG9_HYAAZ|nr:uncharacterized protein LOC108680369 [Hyalella azteca]
MNLNRRKTFVGVYFNKNDWEIVPRIWLRQENSRLLTYWPDEGDVVTQAKACAPVQRSWQLYPVQQIVEASGDYYRAERKMCLRHITQKEAHEKDFSARRVKNEFSIVSSCGDDSSSTEIPPSLASKNFSGIKIAHDDVNARPGLQVELPRSDCSPTRPKERLIGEEEMPSSSRSPAPVMSPFSPVENDSAAQTSGPEMSRTILQRLDVLESNQKIIRRNLERIISITASTNLLVKNPLVHNNIGGLHSSVRSFDPASTLDELDQLLEAHNIIERLRGEEFSTSTATLKAMIRKLVARSLLTKFSISEHDPLLPNSKICMRSHKIYDVLFEALERTIHRGISRSNFDSDLQTILCHACNRSSNHKSRREKLVNTQRRTSSASEA